MEEDTFEDIEIPTNVINFADFEERSTPKKETDPPERPIVVDELLLYDSKGRKLDYLVTHNHILINRACAKETKKKLRPPVYYDDSGGD